MNDRLAELRALPVPEGLPRLEFASLYPDGEFAVEFRCNDFAAWLHSCDPRATEYVGGRRGWLVGFFPSWGTAVEALRSLGYRDA